MRLPKSNLLICAWVPYPIGISPGQRYRLEQWTPYLERNGIKVAFFPFANPGLLKILHQPDAIPSKVFGLSRAVVHRISHFLAAQRYDAVVIHRAACLAGPALFERMLHLTGRPVIFDFDDAIFLKHTTAANERFGWVKFPGKTAAICRLSQAVVVGNSYLADYARQFNPRVTIIPTSVDTVLYRPAPKSRVNGRVIVGWTGSSTSQTYLEASAPLLRRWAERSDVEIRVHSDRRPELPGVAFVWRRWSAETEVEEIRQFDIGIMPMPDDPWARGKCAMKAMLYMSLGIPAVCSAVGANRDLIQHEINGLLANGPEDWDNCLEQLIADPAYRERLGQGGRRTIEEIYSKERSAALFAQVVRQAVLGDRGQRAEGRGQ